MDGAAADSRNPELKAQFLADLLAVFMENRKRSGAHVTEPDDAYMNVFHLPL